jgi:hypothetical protein
MNKKIPAFLCLLHLFILSSLNAQQIAIPRIDLMPDKPSPYLMRDWKQVAINYDNYVFNTSASGTYLPLSSINTSSGVNYSDVQNLRMDSYVGQSSHGKIAEAINIIPAVVGASLVGINKTNHLNTNWVTKIKDFFNLKNGQNVYLNGYSSSTGNDWWYELMPNVFFYQLYSLYPDADKDFGSQFTAIADRQLNVLFELGAKLQPWTAPQMNYRAFNLLTGQPNASSVPEPESAGSIAWLLYQAYTKTGDVKYLQGTQLALDFLLEQTSNPSYEIQLPYGIAAAARMNAQLGTNYNIEKLLNWAFSSGAGTLRGWGAIVGTWNGYDVDGLIGEANDGGNGYAFSMNGFQHAAALAPVVKYDKRFAKALGKWILNVANASRLFYGNGLPADNQQVASNTWIKQYDPAFCIPFEAIKQNWLGKIPFAMGDAVKGGWASTDLSLYSGSSVGYMASIIAKTNVEGVLQIDLNKTDFRGENTYPVYLYYNPYTTTQYIQISLPSARSFDLYDAISETNVASNVVGNTSFSISPNGTRMIVLIPSGKTITNNGRIRKADDGVVDFHYGYDYTNALRIKAFTSDTTKVVSPSTVTFNCLVENYNSATTYKWFQNGNLLAITNEGSFRWNAPSSDGVYAFKCQVTSGGQTVTSGDIDITVIPEGQVSPSISNFTVSSSEPYNISTGVNLGASISPQTANILWQCSGGEMQNADTPTPTWISPGQPGIYTVSVTATNSMGTQTLSKNMLVKDLNTTTTSYLPVAYYPFNGSTTNLAQNGLDAVNHNATLTTDKNGWADNAYNFASSSQYIAIPNAAALNFTGQLSVSLWMKPDYLASYEQFIISHGSYEERYKMSITPDKKVRWTLKTSQGVADVDDNTVLQAGQFAHFTGLYTGYSLELYRDGVFVAYKPLSGAIGVSTKSITLSRKDESETNYNFRGTIDEVRIYDYGLPSGFIQTLPSLWQLTSGIVEKSDRSRLDISPNPFSDHFSLSIEGNNEPLIVEIFNLQGQKVWSNSEVQNGEPISTESLKVRGVYLLNVLTKSGHSYTGKLLKN